MSITRSPLRSTGFARRPATALTLIAFAIVALPSQGRPALQIEVISNPSGIRIAVEPHSRARWGLLQVVDPATGACLKTVHAGRFAPGDSFAIVPSNSLPAGKYRLRYREGVDLALAGEIKRPDAAMPKWLNPVDVTLVGAAAYVFDSGEEVADKVPALAAERVLKQPYIFKMDRDGKADPSFGDAGRLALPGLYRTRSFAVDPSGKIFVATGGHSLRVYEANGTPTKQLIGGWDNNPAGPQCTPWVDPLCLGWKNRIYIPSPGYARGRVYDRTKENFSGVIYSWVITDVNGTQRGICSDGQGSIYYAGLSQRVSKFTDNDTAMVPAGFLSSPDAKLAHPTGGCASAGLVWWACHGPGFGPFWDSGGGGEIVLFFDNGKEPKLIDRFGLPGTQADRMQFLNPSAVAMDAAHDEVWVTEDSLPNPDGPRGNARVRKFLLKSRHSETVEFELPR